MKKSLNSIYAILAQKAKFCIRLAAAAVMVFAVSFPLCAVQKTIVLGGENGWNNMAAMDGVTTGSGRYGFESIELETQAPALDGETDLLGEGGEGEKCGRERRIDDKAPSVA